MRDELEERGGAFGGAATRRELEGPFTLIAPAVFGRWSGGRGGEGPSPGGVFTIGGIGGIGGGPTLVMSPELGSSPNPLPTLAPGSAPAAAGGRSVSLDPSDRRGVKGGMKR
jgi:hypothetical protein